MPWPIYSRPLRNGQNRKIRPNGRFPNLTGGSHSVGMTGENATIGAIAELAIDGGPADVVLAVPTNEQPSPMLETRRSTARRESWGIPRRLLCRPVDQAEQTWSRPFVFDAENDITVALRHRPALLTRRCMHIEADEYTLEATCSPLTRQATS